MAKSAERLPPAVKRSVMLWLDDHIIDMSNGSCKYKGDMSDDKVASRFHVSLWSVQNLRRQFFGTLISEGHGAHGQGPIAVAFQKIAALEEEMRQVRAVLDRNAGRLE